MLNFIRVLCLLLTIGAAATAWIWTERSKWVHMFDWHATALYERGYEDEIRAIRKSLAKKEGDREAHLERLEEIRKKCKHAVFADRLFLPWRHSVDLLSEVYMEEARYEDAIGVLKPVPKKDPTHIPMILRLASAYCMKGDVESLEKAHEITEAWAPKLPTHPGMRATQMLVTALQGRIDELASIIKNDLYQTTPYLMQGWQLFIFGPDGSGLEKSPLVNLVGPDDAGMYELAYTFPSVPEALFQVRLDGPIFTRLQISNVSIELTKEGQPIADTTDWNWNGFVAVEDRPGGVYVYKSNKDPRIRMRFPKQLKGLEGPVDAKIRLRLDPILSNELRILLAEPELRSELTAKLNEAGWAGSLDLVCPPPIGVGGSQ